MKKQYLTFFFAILFLGNEILAQNYQNHTQLSSRLKELATKNASVATLKNIGKTRGGRDISVLSLSKGDAASKPAILIVAGIDGTHLAGSEVVIQMAQKLLASNVDSVSKLLETKTLYFLPRLNADAQEQFFAALKFERSGNDATTDDDRDGNTNEDPFDDLNKDGIITQIRIEDPTGTFIESKDDPRVLIKADPAKGETGKYIVLTEGIDNDKDGNFNEDGIGGTNPDKNFAFDYPIFVAGSGEYAASEPETRALMDFVYSNPNIYAVITLGPANNLSEAPRFDPAKAATRIIKGPLAKDAAAGEQISKLYNATGLKNAPTAPQTKGNFAQTAYYHAGRFSFSTPAWWSPKVEVVRDSARSATPTTTPQTPSAARGGSPTAASRPVSSSAITLGDDDLRFLKWADKEKINNVFVNWTAVSHPDFPDRKVEVGGIAPFAKTNPPVSYLAEVANKHLGFLAALGKQMPSVDIVNVKNESLGAGLSRVTVTVVNKGLLPTYAEIGDRIRWVQKMRTEVKLATGQSIVSGRKIMLRNSMAAGEKEEYSWLISGTGKVSIEAGCATTGLKAIELTLK